MTNKYICIHGHFYQPPRENPWLEDIELQDSAYPYHDWNEKITEECYRQNAASRILGPNKKIINIINNYARISFDFGPTLLSWLEKYAPDVYESVIEADRQSMEFFSGHGAAIALPYNHMIMPLANARDKQTQVIWGIRYFEYHFKRPPEGMWLPETAVDMDTLEILAQNNIKFTVLAPRQVRQVCKIGQDQWNTATEETIDTTRPYLCKLASGRTINLFFYHGPVSQGIAYGGLLQSGENFASKLLDILNTETKVPGPPRSDVPKLAHVATDGETYGHHHRNADMALAYCLHHVEANNLAKITVYGEFLEKFPPEYEAKIRENTSWSCDHGIERWKSNCGCVADKAAAGKQQWREPLRKAMDWLRDKLISVYEDKMRRFNDDPWAARDKYISVVNKRTIENTDNFLSELTGKKLSQDEKIPLLKLLEMQRNAMLMYTSCGWFFESIAGIESIQIMNYASRTMQLAKELDAEDLEPEYMKILEQARCDTKGFATGKEVYQAMVKPSSIDLNRVGAHLALSSIFEDYAEKTNPAELPDCYSANIESYERTEAGIQKLVVGRATVQSNIVLEKHRFDFAVLHFGDHNLIGSVNACMPDQDFANMSDNLKKAFAKGDTTEVIRIMNTSFSGNSYSLWHLFKDQQRRILYELLESTWQEIEADFQHIYEHNYTIMQIMRAMFIPLPKALSTPAEFILNRDLCKEIRSEHPDIARLRLLAGDATGLSLQLDEDKIRFEAGHKINELMSSLEESPDDISLLETIENTIEILASIVSRLDLQKAQNIFFALSREKHPEMSKKADAGDENAGNWCRHFDNLARSLGVVIQ